MNGRYGLHLAGPVNTIIKFHKKLHYDVAGDRALSRSLETTTTTCRKSVEDLYAKQLVEFKLLFSNQTLKNGSNDLNI